MNERRINATMWLLKLTWQDLLQWRCITQLDFVELQKHSVHLQLYSSFTEWSFFPHNSLWIHRDTGSRVQGSVVFVNVHGSFVFFIVLFCQTYFCHSEQWLLILILIIFCEIFKKAMRSKSIFSNDFFQFPKYCWQLQSLGVCYKSAENAIWSAT